MKLKYNHNGKTESITLSKKKLTGKRIAVRHNGENFYAPLVDAGDATASNLRTKFNGKILAVRALPPPEIENILIAPPRVSVMQGQSATAIVSAEGNEAVAGLSFSIVNNPTWITIADECILIQPSDNDQGEAIVKVIAKDTGSDASASAAFVAEARLRPIIESLSVIPPAVTVSQGSTSTAIVQAVANSAVGGLSYSLDGAPSWVSLDQDTIHIAPTTNDTGTSTVQVVAYDTNSSARADTNFVAEAKATLQPSISPITCQTAGTFYWMTPQSTAPTAFQQHQAWFTVNATGNEAVQGITYSTNHSGVTLVGNKGTVDVSSSYFYDGHSPSRKEITITAKDTGSDAFSQTTIPYTLDYRIPVSVKVSPTYTNLVTGTSGTQTSTFKVTLTTESFLMVRGSFPKNADISISPAGTSTLKTITVKYPKASQVKETNWGLGFNLIPYRISHPYVRPWNLDTTDSLKSSSNTYIYFNYLGHKSEETRTASN